jgi:uncharacterized membrane protein
MTRSVMTLCSLSWCRWALVGLLVLQLVWFGWLQNPGFPAAGLILLISAGPLLLLLPGVWRLRQRPLVIAGFVLMFYFCFAVMEAFANPGTRLAAGLQIALITVYFIALPTIRRHRARPD